MTPVLFASGLDLPVIGHVSPVLLIVLALAAYLLWPRLQQLQAGAVAAPVSLLQAAEPRRVARRSTAGSGADFAALEELIAERNRLNALIAASRDRAKQLLDAEAKP